MSKPDETTCKIVINSTLPDDKGTWRIIIEAEENENNLNTYEYLHILDVQVYRKYMNVTKKYFYFYDDKYDSQFFFRAKNSQKISEFGELKCRILFKSSWVHCNWVH